MADLYGVVRTDNMAGTTVGSYLVSAKYFETVTVDDDETEEVAAPIENGRVVKVGNYLDGEREVRKATVPAANDSLDDIVLVTTPEVMYDERKKNLDEFRNEAGEIIRGHRLHKHDLFSVTANDLAIDDDYTPTVGCVAELTASTKIALVASATASTTTIGCLEAIEKAGRYTYYVIRVQ